MYCIKSHYIHTAEGLGFNISRFNISHVTEIDVTTKLPLGHWQDTYKLHDVSSSIWIVQDGRFLEWKSVITKTGWHHCPKDILFG